MRSKKYNKLYYLLRTVTGIGPLTAAALITAIGDMKRFSSFYHLNSFIGLVPIEHSIGGKALRGRITVRKHRQLRSDLVEYAWTTQLVSSNVSFSLLVRWQGPCVCRRWMNIMQTPFIDCTQRTPPGSLAH